MISRRELIFQQPDALSVTRGRLLEVEYTIRVCVNAGSFASNVQVVLPIRIINFLSIDPPPRFPSYAQEESLTRNIVYGNQYIPAQGRHRSRPVIEGLFSLASRGLSDSQDLRLESEETSPDSGSDDNNQSEQISIDYEDRSDLAVEELESYVDDDQDSSSEQVLNPIDVELGHLYLDDDSDEAINRAISSARIGYAYGKNAARFADLYYASAQDSSTGRDSSGDPQDISGSDGKATPEIAASAHQTQIQTSERTPEKHHRTQTDAPSTSSRPGRPRGPSLFAVRVQEKLQALANNKLGQPDIDQGEDHYDNIQGTATKDQVLVDADLARHSRQGSNIQVPFSTTVAKSSETEDSQDLEAALKVKRLVAPSPIIVDATPTPGYDSGYPFPSSISGMGPQQHDDPGNVSDNDFVPTDSDVSSGVAHGNAKAISPPTTGVEQAAPNTGTGLPNPTGSRLLPNPPVLTVTTNTNEDTLLSVRVAGRASGDTDLNTKLGKGQSRLPLACASAEIPISSVKAKIRELEERAKALSRS
jgi:hypothetical protein